MTIKFRYKKPDEDVSKLIVHPLIDSNTILSKTSDNFRWSASVAAFGMLLRDSEYSNNYSYDAVVQLAQNSLIWLSPSVLWQAGKKIFRDCAGQQYLVCPALV